MNLPWTQAVLTCFVLFVAFGCHQERNESIKLMNDGLAKIKRDKLMDGLQSLSDAALVDPTNHRAFFYQGLVQVQKLGNPKKGETLFRKALALADEHHEYHYQLGVALFDQKRWQDAIEPLQRATELTPSHGESFLRLGLVFEQLSKFDASQEMLREAVRQAPTMPETYNALGSLYARFEKYDHAAQVLRNGIENNPGFALNHQDLGLVYRNQSRFDEALAQFRRARQLEPGKLTILFNMGMTQVAAGQTREAITTLKTYLLNTGGGEDPLRESTARKVVRNLESGRRAE